MDRYISLGFMGKRVLARLLVIIITMCMIAAAIPFALFDSSGLFAYAAATAPGGTVESDDDDALTAALGGAGNVGITESTTGGKSVITATLKNDTNLSAPLKFEQGAAGSKVIINLNSKTLTGAAGTSGSDEDAAMGQSAIEIEAGAFDVEIKGPGSVIGGKGAVLHDEGIDFKSGYYGGDAVRFINSSYYPTGANARLDYGLTVKGGAVLTGGDGGDVSSTEWLYDIEHYNGDIYGAPNFVSGSGGAGIGQETAGLEYDNTISYAKIVVDNGTVFGGLGGNINMSAITPTTYALMTSSAVAAVMDGVSVDNYPFKVLSFAPKAGRGG